jgi:hypothetical protein
MLIPVVAIWKNHSVVLPWNRHSLALLPQRAEKHAYRRPNTMGFVRFAPIPRVNIDKMRCFGSLGIVFCSLYKHTRKLCPRLGFEGVAGPNEAEMQRATDRILGTKWMLQNCHSEGV